MNKTLLRQAKIVHKITGFASPFEKTKSALDAAVKSASEELKMPGILNYESVSSNKVYSKLFKKFPQSVGLCDISRSINKYEKERKEDEARLQNIIKDLKDLPRIVDRFEFDKSSLIVITNDIIVSNYLGHDPLNLGKFRIIIGTAKADRRSWGYVTEIGFEKETKKELGVPARVYADHKRCIHPHVFDGQMCMGNAAPPLKIALKEGRIFDAIEILLSVLSNQGVSSVFELLKKKNAELENKDKVVAPVG